MEASSHDKQILDEIKIQTKAIERITTAAIEQAEATKRISDILHARLK